MKNTFFDKALQTAIEKDLQEKGYSNLYIGGRSLWVVTDEFMERFGKIVPKEK